MAVNTILDFFESEDEPTIVLRYFYMDTEAQFAALQLRTSDIPCFISNGNAHTLLPVGQGWIGLHIRQRDLPAAVAALQAVGMWDEADGIHQSADAPPSQRPYWVLAALLLLLAAFLVKFLLFSGQYY